MKHNTAAKISDEHLLPLAWELYGLEGYRAKLIAAHEGGRNLVYECRKEGSGAKILRIAYLTDRSREDFLGEAEYIRYLYEHGGSVSDVVCSRKGNLMEEITHSGHRFFLCLYERARGKLLAENNYRYREGAPLTEYFVNCGKVLGKLHQLSKEYRPIHRGHDFFDKFTAAYLNGLIPDSLASLKEKFFELLKTLRGLDKNNESYGMVHFDYNDGNYHIDFDTGEITVFDFDNCCFCWYLFDLASLWTNGMGWSQFEPDVCKRKEFMDKYFESVLSGYRSETGIDDGILARLPLLIQANLMESIVDAFEVMRNNGREPECDGELAYRIKCVLDDIPYVGFFHEIYSCEQPFEYREPIF